MSKSQDELAFFPKKTNPEKNAQKTQKQSHQRMPWNAKQNKKSEKTRICPLNKCKKRHNKCNKNAPKRHNKCDKNAQTIQKQMQSKSKANAIKHVLVFAFAFFCFVFAFCLRFICIFWCVSLRQRKKSKRKQTRTQTSANTIAKKHIKRTNIEHTSHKKGGEIWLCMCIFCAFCSLLFCVFLESTTPWRCLFFQCFFFFFVFLRCSIDFLCFRCIHPSGTHHLCP